MSLSAAHSQSGVSKDGKDYESLENEKKKGEIQSDFLFLLKEANNPVKPQGRKETAGI